MGRWYSAVFDEWADKRDANNEREKNIWECQGSEADAMRCYFLCYEKEWNKWRRALNRDDVEKDTSTFL